MRASDFPAAVEKWRAWIQEIRNDIGQLVEQDFLFRASMTAAQESGKGWNRSHCYQAIVQTYGAYALTGIRRHLDRQKGVYSLGLLVSQINAHPEAVTRDGFTSQYKGFLNDSGYADSDFDLVCDESGNVLSSKLITGFNDEIESIIAMFRPHMDKTVFHFEISPGEIPQPVWQDIHNAIESLDRITSRLYFVLHQSGNRSCICTEPDVLLEHANKFWLLDR